MKEKLFFMIAIIAQIIALKIFGLLALPIAFGFNLLLALILKYTNDRYKKLFYEAAIEFTLLPLYAVKALTKENNNPNTIFICVACMAMPFLIPPPVDYVICYVVIAACIYIYNTISNNNVNHQIPENYLHLFALASICLILLTAINIISVWALFLPSLILFALTKLPEDAIPNVSQDYNPTQASSINTFLEPFVNNAKEFATHILNNNNSHTN